MLKPPIARIGGKSKLRKKIIEMIPEHTCYCEPFFGAGWVFFGKEQSKIEVINDKDKELINLFKMLKFHSDEVERYLRYEISSRDTFKDYKKMDIEFLTEIQRAVRYIYIISQSFASKGTVYGYGTNTKPSPAIFNEDFSLLRNRLKSAYIENLDYENILDKYDREYTFFFCDPPYIGTAGYEEKFTIEDHINLSNKLKNIEGKFLLTINDHEISRELYNMFNIKEVEVGYSVSRAKEARKKYKELIITNY